MPAKKTVPPSKPDAKTETTMDQLEAKWKRALADYQNLEKRTAKEKHEFVQFATASLVSKLLGVLDDLDRAQTHSQDPGLKLIHNQLQTILKEEGLEEIEAQDLTFNPETMEAIDRVKGKPNQVIQVLSKGYTLNSKVVKPAKVNVGSDNQSS
ncbi:MAG: nucleotide exchange factor GrpE [Candidatus Chisholmbacteria bacterium]|nr:nucleotide exchange factor GrpE [Candidatus Chisholmbacteria bacterium]